MSDFYVEAANDCRLLRDAENQRPQFASNAKAAEFYKGQLSAICQKYGKSQDELILWAEEEVLPNDDLLEALFISGMIHTLENEL